MQDPVTAAPAPGALYPAIKWGVAFVVSLWAHISTTVQLLVMLMALDFFTGLMAGAIQRKLSAEISFRGLAKKCMVMTLVYMGHMITKPLNVGFDLGEMIALAYVVNEVLSITENCVDVGVPIPPVLIQSLAKFRKLGGMAGDITTTIITEETTVIPPAKRQGPTA